MDVDVDVDMDVEVGVDMGVGARGDVGARVMCMCVFARAYVGPSNPPSHTPPLFITYEEASDCGVYSVQYMSKQHGNGLIRVWSGAHPFTIPAPEYFEHTVTPP